MLGLSWHLKGILKQVELTMPPRLLGTGGGPDLGSLREGGPRREKGKQREAFLKKLRFAIECEHIPISVETMIVACR